MSYMWHTDKEQKPFAGATIEDRPAKGFLLLSCLS